MSFFQSESFVNLLQGIEGAEPFIFRGSSKKEGMTEKLVGVCYFSKNKLKRLFTSRILINGEPCSLEFFRNELPERSDWRFGESTGRSVIYTELRFFEPPSDPELLKSLPYSTVQHYLNILVDTTQPSEALFAAVSNSKKRQILASKKSGAIVRPAQTEDEIKQFYIIIRNLYRTRVKKPLIPEEIFYRIFHDKNSGVVLLAIFQEKVIGGMLCPFQAGVEMCEWYVAGMDQEMKPFYVYPSVLLTWEAIRYASEHGFRQFNFMGAGVAGKQYGTRDFKMQFGGSLVDAPRYFFVHKPFLFMLGRLAIRFGLGS
jgi:serine/alanine adding enzyme